MDGEFIQLLPIYHLKDVLCECITSKVFLEMKEIHFLVPIIKSEAYWDYHFSVIQALYPLYRLLHLADMKEPGIDKVKYYVMQFDRLLMGSATFVVRLRVVKEQLWCRRYVMLYVTISLKQIL